MTQTDEHNWFEQATAAYLADGLSDDERERFERHASECVECAAALAEQRDLDRSMMSLFNTARPATGLADRVIERLRQERAIRLRIHPFVRRAAISAAAVITLGMLGVVATQVIEGDGFPFTKRYAASQGIAPPVSGKPAYETIFAYKDLSARDQSAAVQTPSSASAPEAVGQITSSAPGSAGEIPIRNRGPQRIHNEDQMRAAEKVKDARGLSLNENANGTFDKAQPGAIEIAAETKADIQLGDREDKRSTNETQPTESPVVAESETTQQRHIIRNGDMEFEIERFDTALALVTKITEEEGGFVATTNSEKLDNGKTRGTVVVRIAPEKLNTLAAKLRALGELKRQAITAQEITKQYTDLQSRLRAARAMEERLLEILKTGKGEVKELLAVETQLGATREKIESIEGEIRYYDNLTSLATLTITLAEKDIQSPASVIETHVIDMVVATASVEQASADLMKQIEAAGGRVVKSSTEQLPDGAFAGTIVVLLPIDKGEPIVERLRQVGYVSELNRSVSQAAVDGRAIDPNVRVDRKEVRLSVSLVDLVSTTPRETVSINASAYDVAAMYNAVCTLNKSPLARVRSAQLTDTQPHAVSGVWQIDLPSDQIVEVKRIILEHGAITTWDVIQSESPSRMDGRTRVALIITDVDQMAARQQIRISVQTADVEAKRDEILKEVGSDKTRIIASTIARQSDDSMLATLQFEVPIDRADTLLAKISSAGKVQERSSNINENMPLNSVAKARIDLQLSTRDAIVNPEQGIGASIRKGLATSAAGLLWSLQMVVIGCCFILPWALILWLIHRIFRKRNKRLESTNV